jgi:hypothetical protein
MLRCFYIFLFLLSFPIFGQKVKVSGSVIGKNKKPLENVIIRSKTNPVITTYSDSTGKYVMLIPKVDSLILVFTIDNLQEIRTFSLGEQNFFEVPTVQFPILQQEVVNVVQSKQDPFQLEKMTKVDVQKIAGSVERALTLTTAATSNNELTTNYNVRGGNYDENLVYVNGFLVHRPFLTRSGQQEGMSFIHSALVEDVRFSAGGFDAQYGDRLSSVLDITYKTPKKFNASAMTSLMGVEGHVEQAVSEKFNYLVGARYRNNGYLLNSLPTKGSYNPVFADAQMLLNWQLTPKLQLTTLAHFSSNNFRFAPQTSQTDFGTANEAYSFRIYFEGQEQTRFQTLMGGVGLKYKPSEKTQLDFFATAFNTDEREYFDILGQYFINQLETNPAKEEFGDSIAVLGIGSFLNHARNRLNATIVSAYHNGSHEFFKGFRNNDQTRFSSAQLKWGVQVQRDQFSDVLSEWRLIDSAGYSLPQGNPDEVELFETIKGRLNLEVYRSSAFVQWNQSWSNIKRNVTVSAVKKYNVDDKKFKQAYTETLKESSNRWALSAGLRAVHTTINNEFFVTPRVSLTYFPRIYMVQNDRVVRRNLSYRLSTGMYYQPPFYREFRTFNGQINPEVKAQKSLHVVAGTDFFFNLWGREQPFKFSGELYYKYLWDVNPYEIENVRTRYYADNNAVAFAYGVDMNIHGEFVPGIQSFFKMGLMRTMEDILDDEYTEYYNAAGERIIFGFSADQNVVDSSVIFPGYIPRLTDQFFTFGALVQDQMPGLEQFSVQMGLQFGSRLPYGPPDFTRYKDTLRLKSYFRVDLGLSYDLLYKPKEKQNFWRREFSEAIVSLEIFNILGINNVLSKQWIQDIEGKYYSIPNYLTQRRVNLKLILRLK